MYSRALSENCDRFIDLFNGLLQGFRQLWKSTRPVIEWLTILDAPAVTSVTPFVSSDQSDFKTWSTKFLRIVNQSAYIEDGSKKMHLGKSDDWFTITDACKLATSIQVDQQSGHESDEISAPVIPGLLANSTVFFAFYYQNPYITGSGCSKNSCSVSLDIYP